MADIETKTVRLNKIKLNPDNPRRISDRDMDLLVNSIQQFPDMMKLREIVVDETMTVLGGNMRVLALRKIGFQEATAKIVKGLTASQKREFVIKDNSSFGEWDMDALANEWSELPLAEWGVDLPEEWMDGQDEDPRDAEPQIDKAAELNKKWKVKAGDLFRIGDHRLLCGDSTKREDVERVMGGERADCVFTSPPYAVGVDYGDTYQDTIDNLRTMLPVLADSWIELVKPGGFAVVNFSDIASASKIVGTDGPCEYPMALEYWPVFRAAGWVLWSRRIWCKPNARVHSPWAIQSNRASSDWEHVWTFKSGGQPIIKRVNGEAQSANGWFDTTHEDGVAHGKDEHGAGMATALPTRMVPIHSECGGIVFEPFTGSGTTMVACQNLNRKCLGIEISPEYCAVILQRMKDAFPGIEIEKI